MLSNKFRLRARASDTPEQLQSRQQADKLVRDAHLQKLSRRLHHTASTRLASGQTLFGYSAVQDIAIVTGAEFVAKDLGMKVETTGPESLGTARKVNRSVRSCFMTIR